MALTVQEFYEAVKTKGLSRDFLFRVTGISMGESQVNAIAVDELLFARAASVPGRIIQDNIANYSGHEFHLGGRATYSQSAGYPIEFYCDEGAGLRKTLEGMSKGIFDSGVAGGGMKGNYGINKGGSIDLEQLGKNFSPVMKYKLEGASIREIGDIDYVIADGIGAIVTFSATFAYQYYTMSDPNAAAI